MWTCLVQVRHSEHQDDEDAEDVDDGHLLGIPHMYWAEVGRRSEQNIHQFDNILFYVLRIEIIRKSAKNTKMGLGVVVVVKQVV